MRLGSTIAVGLHDRLDRQPVGGGDLDQRVALLHLVEARLRGRRRAPWSPSWSWSRSPAAWPRAAVSSSSEQAPRRRPHERGAHARPTTAIAPAAWYAGTALLVPAMPDADVTYPGARAPDRQYRLDAARHRPRRLRVGRRRRAAAARRPRRLRLRPDLRRLRPAAGRRRVARRQLGPARPRRQRPCRAVLVGRRPARRAQPCSTTSARPRRCR